MGEGQYSPIVETEQPTAYIWIDVPLINIIRIGDPFVKWFNGVLWFLKKEKYVSEGPKQTNVGEESPKRSLRADAVRNEDAVLEAAKEVFTTVGVDAPVRDIAAKAGVGVGTLYRRFPKRSDLVAGVFRREVDGCAAQAEVLSTQHPPDVAFTLWLRHYTDFLATKKGLAAALHSGDPAFNELPEYFRSRFEPALVSLLEASVAAGDIRGDVEAYDLLRGIGNLSVAKGDDGIAHTHRMLDLLVDGLRYGAGRSR